MYRRNEFLNSRFYSALFILAVLLFSLIIPTQPRVSANINPVEVSPGSYMPPSPARTRFGNTPLLFEANKGQMDEDAKFVSRGKGYTVYLSGSEAVFSLKVPSDGSRKEGRAAKSDVLRMKFAGANTKPVITGETEAITKTNYYIGKKSFENVPNYGRVKYQNLYSGIDAIFYGDKENQLEYDFVVAPNSDPAQIRLNFEGAESLAVNERGDLVVRTANTELIQQRPFSYQEIEGQKHEVTSRYVLSDRNSVKFELGEYDQSKHLVIDPAVQYLTYIGGSLADTVSDIDADREGNAYITGEVNSLDFPVPNSRQARNESGIYVSKIDPSGQTILFNTFLDGSRSDGDFATSLAVSAAGDVYIASTVESTNYPTTAGSFQPNKSLCIPLFQCLFNSEAVVTKLNANGIIVYSTYLGGPRADVVGDIAVDSAGRAYVTGHTLSSPGFPKKNEFQGLGSGVIADAFLTVFNTDGSDIIYSTGLGGNSTDVANAIALDADDNAYITGMTGSDGTFPVKNPFQASNGGGKDAFVAKFNPFAVGSASLVYSTLLGGGGRDEGLAIAVNSNGLAHITGVTESFDYPLKNPFRSTNQISEASEAFVTVLDPTGSQLVNSSFLGGSDEDRGTGIAVRNDDVIFVAGATLSSDFPVSQAFQATRSGQEDAFITKLRFGTGIMWSSYLGGNRSELETDLAVEGNFVWVAGLTFSNNLATTPGVIRPTSNAADNDTIDGFVAKIFDTSVDSVGVFRPASTFLITQSTTTILSQTATFTTQMNGQKGVSGDWEGDGIDSIGSFTNGTWKLRNLTFPVIVVAPTFGIRTVTFGVSGDLPVPGDWNGDGVDTPGVFRPSTGQFILTDSTDLNPSTFRDLTRANFGTAGDLPISGDWDGDGKDSVAVYRPSTGETFFTDDDLSTGQSAVLNPAISFVAFLGIAEDLPFAGDWDGDGKDSLAFFRPSTTEMILTDDNVNLRAVFLFGQSTDQPIAGDWDGKPNP